MEDPGRDPAGSEWLRVARLDELTARGCMPVSTAGHTIALFAHGDGVYAVDNRCPHMGFPLHRGTVRDGILTCHWHHARFDLASGGTFDPFAGDVPTFPAEVRDGEVWVAVGAHADDAAYHERRLATGLELDIPLVMAKSILSLARTVPGMQTAVGQGIAFATRYRAAGWGQGATMLTCMANLLSALAPADRPRALYHGAAAVARDCAGEPARFPLDPLPDGAAAPDLVKAWFRQFVEVRDAEGAERCLVTAVARGAAPETLADMLFAAATDHRYLQIGHVLDFTNKALEALDLTRWREADVVLGSLARAYARAGRMEESNSWRHPVDLVAILEAAFDDLPRALAAGADRGPWDDEDRLVPVLLADDPAAIAGALLGALEAGATATQVAAAVAYAAALRIARFHEQNEFADWDTALHTFTFAHAVHAGLRRSPSAELLRGAFDAAMSVYLDRFLNIPAAKLPTPDGSRRDPQAILAGFPDLLDEQHAIGPAAQAVADYLAAGGEPDALLARLGALLLREDRDFHTIQTVEAAVAEFRLRRGTPEGANILVAAARYLAAHAPTMRAQGQTFEIAQRFVRGENLYEEA